MYLYLLFLLTIILQSHCDSMTPYYLFRKNIVNTLLTPTLGAKNSLCYNHSKFYWEELGKWKLWATEMYDASAKFPSGILYGSPYALGNFDQCLEIKVPRQNELFVGKYCMAKITIIPNTKFKLKEKINYEFSDYTKFYNISAWSKVLAYKNEISKASRNEIYFSICMPSSCTSEDLKERLLYLSKTITSTNNEFDITIGIDERNCQIKKEYKPSTGDIVFIAVVAFFILLVLVCSIYDLLSRSEDGFLLRFRGNWHTIFLCFSFPYNLKKLATKTENDDGLDCLAGIKVISLFLIIFGHRCMFTFGGPLYNAPFIEEVYSKAEAATILNGPIIVDTFFLIAGFLSSYFILTKLEHSIKLVNILLIFVHRLIRMVPVYGIVLAFYCTIYYKIGSGPFWEERIGVERERCLESWWTNILYINNYVNVEKLCMFQSWYLTCDMHYFLLVPILVILLKWKVMLGIGTILVLLVCSAIIVTTSVYIYKEEPILLLYTKLLKDPVYNTTFRDIYIPSHMRSSPYFLGVLTGYIKYRMKNSAYKLPKWMNRTGWCIASLITIATIHIGFLFYLPQFAENSVISAVYGGFHHVTFVLGIAWAIISISSGRGPWIEPILSWRPFIILSRISYTTFLCHGAIQLYTAAVLRQPSYTSVFSTFYEAFGDIVMSFSFGFLLSMVFESPIIGIERLIFSKNTKKPQHNTTIQEDKHIKQEVVNIDDENCNIPRVNNV
ncbi:nose resistant to fluoxetine protein 6-like [Diorhabda carinulata]|uniref:nose resistant to fluoxetine protein 6-like n=1 Tax=Diorhabda carinulata TaxID=1163345 RepID=UPI0025A1F3A4|nr:nose resistant to fluoxetine protein 6-like [Diorhabda carinulata]